jgi:hypothetical protein
VTGSGRLSPRRCSAGIGAPRNGRADTTRAADRVLPW